MQEMFFQTMLGLAKDAGHIALDLIGHSKPSFKPDDSVITVADQSISQLAHGRLASLLSTPDHILIDEEDPAKSETLDEKFLQTKKYLWAVDPIDGTRLYANQMPLYAVSIGLIRDLKPWLGVVYFPSLKELFYHDGEQAYFVQNAFTTEENKQAITPQIKEISSQSLLLMSDLFMKKYRWDSKDCRLMMTGCAAVNLCWPSIGRGCGSMDRSYLWDFAGAWPIVRAAGLEMRELTTGDVLDHVDIKKFSKGSSWRVKEYHLLSSQENFSSLRKKIREFDNQTEEGKMS